NSKLYLNAFYNHFKDDEYRYAFALEPDNATRELTNRIEENKIISGQIGGVQNFGGGFEIDYQLGHSYASQKKPFANSFDWALGYEDSNGNSINFISFDRSKNPYFPQFTLSPTSPENANLYDYSAY